MADADPILETLRAIEDPNQYVFKASRPVFNAHTVTVFNKDGVAETKTVTDADLPEWAAEGQRLEAENGAVGLLRLGHIKPGKPELEQPPVAGLFKNMRVARYGPKQKLGIIVDEYIKKKYESKLPDLPHRSVEIYRDKKQIRNVALLATDPRLDDIGMTLYQSGEPLELYSLESAMADESKPDAVENTKPDAPATPDPALVAALVPLIVAAMQAQGLLPAPAAAAAPAAQTTAPVTYSGTAKPELYQAMQAELETLKHKDRLREAEVKNLKDQANDAKVRTILHTLTAEHYSFDAAAEHALMMPLDDGKRAERANYIRKHHQKVPADGELLEMYGGPVEGPAGEAAKANAAHLKAMDHMRANPGTTYEAAVSATSK